MIFGGKQEVTVCERKLGDLERVLGNKEMDEKADLITERRYEYGLHRCYEALAYKVGST